jgi:hypothetical protein
MNLEDIMLTEMEAQIVCNHIYVWNLKKLK